jgi:hypothetical protein
MAAKRDAKCIHIEEVDEKINGNIRDVRNAKKLERHGFTFDFV